MKGNSISKPALAEKTYPDMPGYFYSLIKKLSFQSTYFLHFYVFALNCATQKCIVVYINAWG